jgi:hypothetical protein
MTVGRITLWVRYVIPIYRLLYELKAVHEIILIYIWRE